MDLILGIVGIVLSGIVFIVSSNYDNYMYDVVGGGGFPRILAGIVIICCIAIIAQYLTSKKKKKPEEDPKKDTRAALLLVIGVIAYTLLLETVGYLVCTLVMVAYLLWIQGERRPKVLLTSTCVICGFLYIIFVLVLQVKMPTGFLI